MKRILIPTDFSEQAENALKVAAQMAKKNGSEIYVLLFPNFFVNYIAKCSNIIRFTHVPGIEFWGSGIPVLFFSTFFDNIIPNYFETVHFTQGPGIKLARRHDFNLELNFRVVFIFVISKIVINFMMS